MDADAVRTWVEAYRSAWESNDPEAIGGLFTQDATYLTEPYAEPWVGREAIVAEWLKARDEPGQTEFSSEVIAIDGNLAFVQGLTRYLTPELRDYSNLWVIRLAEDGRCDAFTEWWMKHRTS